MKASFSNSFRVVLALWIGLSVSPLAHAQHGGGGGHGGGHAGGGHSGGRGHMHGGAGRNAGSTKPRGITRFPPFRAVRLFEHRHRRHSREPFVANGLFVGGFADCGFWDWNCAWGWDDGWDNSYFDFNNWTYPAPSPEASNPGGSASASSLVTVLYLKDGYSVGVTDYWLENDELHYVTTYGGENAIPVDEIDLQRTVDENAARGAPFVFRPKQAPPLENH